MSIFGTAALFGYMSAAVASCDPNDLNSTTPSQNITTKYVGGLMQSVVVGEQSYTVVRDSEGKISGVVTPSGSILAIDQLATVAPVKSKKPGGAKLGAENPDFIPCGQGGGDSFIMSFGIEKLPDVEITGESVKRVDYWVNILAPIHSDLELSGTIDNSQTDKNKRCEGQKNACYTAVDNDWKSGAGWVPFICQEGGRRAGKYLNKSKYGEGIGIVAAIACGAAQEIWTRYKKKQCDDQFASCLVGP